MSFTVAVIGRPNVGKSTLFNRLTGKKLALVDNTPGVTRDRREGAARISDLHFTLIDTAGLEDVTDDSMESRMRQQTEQAVTDCDVVMFMIDARAGLTPLDKHFSEWARQSDKPVIVVANKCEGKGGDAGYLEAFSLGLGDPVQFSAEHGQGLAQLYDALVEQTEFLIPEIEEDEDPEGDVLNIAIIGRPNAGKSTLINSLIGAERLLTGPEAGITRDSIAVTWQEDGQTLRLYDTAGMRRRSKIHNKLEKLSVSDGLRAVQFAHVVVLLLDAQSPLDRQDKILAQLVAREGRGLIVALNKWDLVENQDEVRKKVEKMLDLDMPESRGVSILTISALTGRGLNKLLPAIRDTYEIWNKRIPTAQLNRWLEGMLSAHPPPAPGGRRIKIRYITQIKARPPTFIMSCSRPDDLPASYQRYLVNNLRESFDLWGTPIRLRMMKAKNPYADKSSR
ncbi:MAG: ribosome biogenesis GTPase Der [Alphaproteobacteria bacterium]|nr:MAG: ribosome biogenesis GTPase Der [Alphaproteobacteria bacterium]